jgi:hypothetical protein
MSFPRLHGLALADRVPLTPPEHCVGASSLKAGNRICPIEAGIRLDDFINRQAILKVLEENVDRHARPLEDWPATEDLRVSDDDVRHGTTSDHKQVSIDKWSNGEKCQFS